MILNPNTWISVIIVLLASIICYDALENDRFENIIEKIKDIFRH